MRAGERAVQVLVIIAGPGQKIDVDCAREDCDREHGARQQAVMSEGPSAECGKRYRE